MRDECHFSSLYVGSLESLWQPPMCTGGNFGWQVHEGCSQMQTVDTLQENGFFPG